MSWAALGPRAKPPLSRWLWKNDAPLCIVRCCGGAMENIIQVENLHVHFYAKEGVVKAVNGVSFALQEEKILAVVGESGSGKTVSALAILGLIPFPGRVVEGRVLLNGENLLEADPERLREIRGQDIGIVFQDAQAALNPRLAIGTQVEEALLAHVSMTKREARSRAEELLMEMGVPDPRRILNQYPFQLSGGMCQRVMLSIALALRPKVLIADEPTSNLDTTLQAWVLDHLRRLKKEYGTTILLITHDMGIVAQMADQVAVMYAGSIVEQSDTIGLFQRPAHPYTWGLFQAIPRLDNVERSLRPMRGRPPDMTELPEECPFIPRCPKATNICRTSPKPALRVSESGHSVACFNEIRYDWAGPVSAGGRSSVPPPASREPGLHPSPLA